MRVKNGPSHHERRNKILKLAKGFRGRRKNYKIAKIAVAHALMDAYEDRRRKKRDMRGLWIVRLGAVARQNGLSYSRFISCLKTKNIILNRKVLANIAQREPAVFSRIIATVK
jgi:large subunit ribosomal protein L20